jgi:arylsulfatase A-like enzyme
MVTNMRPLTANVRVLSIALLAACGGDAAPADLPSGPPTDTLPSFYGEVPSNVLMISIDTFRKDFMGRYDPTGDDTPTLTALARGGVVLDDHLTCSNWTFHGIACTLLGKYTIDEQFTPKLVAGEQDPYPESATFLAEHLADAGYFNVLASTNGWFTDEWQMTQGYAESFVPRDASTWGAWAEARDTLLDAQLAGTDAPWMVHLHLIEPHVPYKAPSAYQPELAQLDPIPYDLEVKDDHYDTTRKVWPTMTDEERALLLQHLDIRYRAELTYLDDQLLDVLIDAQQRGLLDDTLVVVWTDHGEQFWEHGQQSHAYTLHAEENDGIALFWAKNIVPLAYSAPTSSIDIAPTIASLLTGEVPASMTGLPLGEAPADRTRFGFAVARLGALQMAERNGQKLIFEWSGDVSYFDRTTDPTELDDRYDPDDPAVRSLWSELEPMVEAAAGYIHEYPVVWPDELSDTPPE